MISSPNHLHTDQAIACAQAGKHVWIEKPMALSTADADRICDAVDAAGVHSFVGFSVRFDPIAHTMIRLHRDGAVGPLRSIWSRRLCDLFGGTKPSGWRGQYATSGGVMAELLAHEIDWMVAAAGLPDSVSCRVLAEGDKHPRANDHVWLSFGFGTATGTIEGAQNAPIADFYKGIVGDGGSLHTRNWGSELHIKDAAGDRQVTDLYERFDKHGHFLDVIEGKAESVADCHHGRTIVALSELALDATERRAVLPVNLERATVGA